MWKIFAEEAPKIGEKVIILYKNEDRKDSERQGKMIEKGNEHFKNTFLLTDTEKESIIVFNITHWKPNPNEKINI